MDIDISDVEEIGPFEFRWPNGIEKFETGWTARAVIGGKPHSVRHGLGVRTVYGRERVHTVTWLDGAVQVEGVEANDYPVSQALISQLRRAGRATARTPDQVPTGYDQFNIVEHRHEIEARYSPQCLAVKIKESDLTAWTTHAWLRSKLPRKAPASVPGPPVSRAPAPLPSPPSPDARAVVQALLKHGDAMINAMKSSGIAQFTPNQEANQFVHVDGFAFLIAVISDMGIKAERAWELPFKLRERLGGLTPEQVAADPAAVRKAFQQQPKLHRFVNNVPAWISEAARIVIDDYHGDASALWADAPTALELHQRLVMFPGISQKKAAMTVVLLNQCLNVPLRELSGGDVAVDVHLRRVFPRTGLTQDDQVNHIVAAARAFHPEYPGALDMPAWDIGRRWCHRTRPECETCPLRAVCPRFISRARGKGI